MLNLDILISYSFIIVGSGTFLLAAIAGAVGCITVLKGQSLIGDAIGHAAFPGIILSFYAFYAKGACAVNAGSGSIRRYSLYAHSGHKGEFKA